MPFRTFQIAEASISLYPLDGAGQPVADAPIWIRSCAEGVSVKEDLEEVVDKPTAATWREIHHVGEEHEIDIETLWTPVVPLIPIPANITVTLAGTPIGQAPSVTNASDYKLKRGQIYVMVIVWEGEDAKDWAFRVYYGVTDRSGSLASSTPDDGMRSNLQFRAQYYLT